MPTRAPIVSPGTILITGRSPLKVIGVRAAIVLVLIAGVMLMFWLERESLHDNHDGKISFTDIVYFTMVTLTTVGYGDIVPIGERARLLDALIVAPIRLLIWLVFLGTTYQLVLHRVVEDWRSRRFGARMKDHVVVVGFGYEGRMAVRETIDRGHAPSAIVVVDEKEERLQQAAKLGCVGLLGDATKEETMQLARVQTAVAVLVCLPRDDTAALCILTVRNLGSKARLIASAREQENIRLLQQAGADDVVSPAKLGGYLMADAIVTPLGLRFVSELLTARGRMHMVERPVENSEIGMRIRDVPDHLVVALQRGEKIIGFWDVPDERIQADDRLFAVRGVPAKTAT
jgi:voltage-gated potassium channel